MNILLVAPKADIKTYNTIIKTAPNANVLGAVSSIKSEFIIDLKNKFHPHAVLIDTAVPSKTSVADVIFNIKAHYPYMKVIVITDEDDHIDYPLPYTVVRGQVTSVQLKDIIKSINTDSNIPETTSPPYSFNANSTVDDDGSAITEKLTMDKLSTPLKIKQPELKLNKKRSSKKKSPNIKLIAIIPAVVVTFITLIISLSFIKSTLSPTAVATNDEASAAVITTAVEISTFESVASETTLVQKTTENIDEHLAYSETSENGKTPDKEPTAPSSSNKKTNYDNNSGLAENGSAASKTNKNNFSSNAASSKPNSNTQTNNKPANNSSGNNTSHHITYDDKNYNNSNDNAVSSIKLSYNSKTMYEGDKLKLTATVIPSNATYTLSFYSSNTAVAKISQDGSVVALKPGTAKITCKANNKTATCNITVIPAPTKATEKEDNVTLSRDKLSLTPPQTYTLILYNCKKASFVVNNSSIAEIALTTDNAVVIRALSKGTTVLVAVDNATHKTYRCTIKIE